VVALQLGAEHLRFGEHVLEAALPGNLSLESRDRWTPPVREFRGRALLEH
jgi:hypothetical protein